ncbi:MAG: PhzF family phenazine biosynthesis protein [Bacteroidetes bacterium]|nr:PhzF family phenazine biosynthesis protein [Bacteroidota bacterium]
MISRETKNKSMKEIIVKIVYAFSISGTGGNPAGVVLNADHLTHEEKQQIATKVGLSEVAFVSQSSRAAFKLEFFTPTKQIAHCGHATIATFSYLKKTGLIKGDQSSKETIDGNRDIYFKDGLAYMEQTSPSYTAVEADLPEILSSLNLSKADLLNGHGPSIVNTGNSFLIVPVANETILKNIQPDLKKIKSYSEKHNLIGYYIFSLSNENNFAPSTRMFAPLYGIDEEAATGMAAGPLACYLFDNSITKGTEIKIKQGEYMRVPSPSLINVTLVLENDKIKKLYAGGDAFVSREVLIRI